MRYADRGRRVRVRPATRFRIGSVSKTLTSALLGRLLDRGAVELDVPVQRYVPAFPRKTSEITLRLLAGHLAGVRHYRTRREAVNRRHFPSVEAALAVFARDPLVAEPGAAFSYSSYGWNLLGAALARASGSKFATLVREELVRPLGLRATGLASTGRTRFYELTNDGRAVPAPRIDLSDRLPSGGFTASARDVAVVASALASGFVRPETANALFTPQRTRTGEVTGYGLGWEVAPSPVGRLVGHTGAVVGGTAAVLLHPATGVALAIATNVGTVTAAAPPRPRPDTPEPPALLLPFLAER